MRHYGYNAAPPWPASPWAASPRWLAACARPPTRCQPRASCPSPGCRGGAHVGLVSRRRPRPKLLAGGAAPQRGPPSPAAGRHPREWRCGPGAAALPDLYGRGLEWPAPLRARPPAHSRFAARRAWPESAARSRGGGAGRAGTSHSPCGDLGSRPAPLDAERANGPTKPYALSLCTPWPRPLGAGSPHVRRSHLPPRLPFRLLSGPYGGVTARPKGARHGALCPRAGVRRTGVAGPLPCPERSCPYPP